MPRLDAERVALWRRLGGVIGGVQRELDAELTEAHEISLPWFEAMSAIRDSGGTMRVGKLRDALDEVTSSLSRRLDRMEEHGLVVRATPEPARGVVADRRAITVTLTADGRAAWRDANITYRRVVQQRFASRLTETDVIALQRVLGKTER